VALAGARPPEVGAALPGAVGAFEPAKWVLPNADLVLAINVQQLVASPLMKKNGLEGLRDLIKSDPVASEVFKEAGLDPLRDIHAVVVSGLATKEPQVLTVMRGNFDLDRFHAAAVNQSKKHPRELQILKEGGVHLYKIAAQDQHLFGAFAGKETLVFAASKEGALEAVRTGGTRVAPLRRELSAAVDRLGEKDSIGLAMVMTPELKGMMAKVPQAAKVAPKLEAATARVQVTDAATLSLALQATDAKAAKDLNILLQQGKAVLTLALLANEDVGPLAGELLDATRIGVAGNAATVDLRVTNEMIEKGLKKGK